MASKLTWLMHLLIFLCCLNGVVLKFSKDGVALAFCTAESFEPRTNYGRIFAVKRKCSTTGKTCKDICKEIGPTYNCFETINVYDKSAFKYPASFRYRLPGCETKNCGPNYCCCRKK
ncbi:Hypothetical predicted protein [Mytilus galloprovincialis]|uniref:Uncharacterized protein n=1 Tax=Mytilus galloprovincialis TaxID=29158 RepID=A0A8B6DMJ3_MYTGA|nr:Hypothetical predicted protein [Mytilus galloprovincialis]